jgi:hypothetical protein
MRPSTGPLRLRSCSSPRMQTGGDSFRGMRVDDVQHAYSTFGNSASSGFFEMPVVLTARLVLGTHKVNRELTKAITRFTRVASPHASTRRRRCSYASAVNACRGVSDLTCERLFPPGRSGDESQSSAAARIASESRGGVRAGTNERGASSKKKKRSQLNVRKVMRLSWVSRRLLADARGIHVDDEAIALEPLAYSL